MRKIRQRRRQSHKPASFAMSIAASFARSAGENASSAAATIASESPSSALGVLGFALSALLVQAGVQAVGDVGASPLPASLTSGFSQIVDLEVAGSSPVSHPC
jgi:hypothetical protein